MSEICFGSYGITFELLKIVTTFVALNQHNTISSDFVRLEKKRLQARAAYLPESASLCEWSEQLEYNHAEI